MNDLDIQVFPASGVWHKPPQSVRVNVVLQAGDSSVEKGESITHTFLADELPDELNVTVGEGGRPNGVNGYAIVVTELSEQDST